MWTFARLAVGTVLSYGSICLSVAAYGLVAAFLPMPVHWWKEHATAMVSGHEALAVLPFVVITALLLRRLFPERTVFYSLISIVAAFAVISVPDAMDSLDLAISGLSLAAELVVMFVLGVPAIVLGIQRWRPNPAFNRTRRRRA